MTFCDADADCSGVVDVAFALHSGGSVHVERWRYVKQFAADFINELDVHPDRTRVSVLYWNTFAYVAFPFDKYTTRHDAREVAACFL